MKRKFADPQAEFIILLTGDIITESKGTDYIDGSSSTEEEVDVDFGL